MKRIGVGIIGGTGYGAGELLRLLCEHQEAEVLSVVSSSAAGEKIADTHKQLASFYSGKFDSKLEFDKFSTAKEKIIFLGLPHGKSPEAVEKFLAEPKFKEFKLIDLAGDFRLRGNKNRALHYPQASAQVAEKFVYGLTEINREQIAAARFVANPGCLASACALSVLPLVRHDYAGTIAFDGKTGTSGAGRNLQESMHHPTRHNNVSAYRMLEHRHEPEICEALGDLDGSKLQTFFVPHLLPAVRGIYATAYLTLEKETTSEVLEKLYQDFYRSSPFIRVRSGAPDLQSVLGSNFCDVGVVVRGKQVVAMAALDNLVKGMAGQAIQNMNLMAGLDEKIGLWNPGLGVY